MSLPAQVTTSTSTQATQRTPSRDIKTTTPIILQTSSTVRSRAPVVRTTTLVVRTTAQAKTTTSVTPTTLSRTPVTYTTSTTTTSQPQQPLRIAVYTPTVVSTSTLVLFHNVTSGKWPLKVVDSRKLVKTQNFTFLGILNCSHFE